MVSADQLLQCDVRLRQAKMKDNLFFGGLALNVCGDFLQLPPVDKDGTRKSLAVPMEDFDLEDETPDAEDIKERARKRAKLAENVQGLDIWRSIKHVVCLQINVRAPGILSRLQDEMRAGAISDDMWELYMSRVLQPHDKRLTENGSTFAKHIVHFIVHRHKNRVLRCLENAKEQSRHSKVPLYIVQARDEASKPEDRSKLTDAVREELLKRVNPEQTKGLPSFLPLCIGMRLTLASKDCVRVGVMKGCTCVLRYIVFSEDEVLPKNLVAGQPHHVEYMPISIFLQAEGAKWTLPADELPKSMPADVDRRGLSN